MLSTIYHYTDEISFHDNLMLVNDNVLSFSANNSIKRESDEVELIDVNIDKILQGKYAVIRKAINTKIYQHNIINVYRFNNIENIHFLIPFSKTLSDNVGVYIQMDNSMMFILVKTFHVSINYQQNALTFLLNALITWHEEINSKDFLNKIRIKWNNKWLESIRTKYSNMLYSPTAIGPNIYVLHRLVEELHINGLHDQYKHLSSHLTITYLKAFNHIAVSWITEDDELSFNSQYKLSRYNFETQRVENEFKYKEDNEIIIKNNTMKPLKHCEIMVRNHELFGTNEYIVMPNVVIFNDDDLRFINSLCTNLIISEDKQMISLYHNDEEYRYGSYNLVKIPGGYKITNISKTATCKSNFNLTNGKWYFEIHILEAKIGIDYEHVIEVGFVDSDFVPLDGGCVGTRAHSWGYRSDGNPFCEGRKWTKDDFYLTDSAKTRWQEGDSIGCAIDIDLGLIRFYKN
eukprot:463385_1